MKHCNITEAIAVMHAVLVTCAVLGSFTVDTSH